MNNHHKATIGRQGGYTPKQTSTIVKMGQVHAKIAKGQMVKRPAAGKGSNGQGMAVGNFGLANPQNAAQANNQAQ